MLKRSNKVEFFIIITNSKCFLFVICWCLSDKKILMIYTKCDIMKQTICFSSFRKQKMRTNIFWFDYLLRIHEYTSSQPTKQPNNWNEWSRKLSGRQTSTRHDHQFFWKRNFWSCRRLFRVSNETTKKN